MGLKVAIYRRASAKQDEVIPSQRFDNFCVVNVPGPSSPSAESPAAVLLRQETGDIILVPQDLLDSGRWFTSSGNYAYASDHRFTDVLETLSGYSYAFPVAIHDRVE